MSALDDAIAASMAHPAGGMNDPLTDSLIEQQACTAPAPFDAAAAAPCPNPQWADEPIEVRFPWWLVAAALLVGCFGLAGLGLPQ